MEKNKNIIKKVEEIIKKFGRFKLLAYSNPLTIFLPMTNVGFDCYAEPVEIVNNTILQDWSDHMEKSMHEIINDIENYDEIVARKFLQSPVVKEIEKTSSIMDKLLDKSNRMLKMTQFEFTKECEKSLIFMEGNTKEKYTALDMFMFAFSTSQQLYNYFLICLSNEFPEVEKMIDRIGIYPISTISFD